MATGGQSFKILTKDELGQLQVWAHRYRALLTKAVQLNFMVKYINELSQVKDLLVVYA